ncbi:hypothetical protein [Pseudonocardia sp. NPDC049154]|uniref:hypothetical protein n=1 Tax=Pseudonocardia sp. NPDC049154 TaxID=3155501 RepID=UPI0033FD2789
MRVGDILDGAQLAELPVGAVVVHDDGGGMFNTVTRSARGYTWTSQSSRGLVDTTDYGHGGIVVGEWKLVHLPESEPLKVGDLVEDRAAELPPGTVAIDDGDEHAVARPAIKVGDGRWLYWVPFSHEAGFVGDETVDDHRILHIPGADSSTGRSAA